MEIWDSLETGTKGLRTEVKMIVVVTTFCMFYRLRINAYSHGKYWMEGHSYKVNK